MSLIPGDGKTFWRRRPTHLQQSLAESSTFPVRAGVPYIRVYFMAIPFFRRSRGCVRVPPRLAPFDARAGARSQEISPVGKARLEIFLQPLRFAINRWAFLSLGSCPALLCATVAFSACSLVQRQMPRHFAIHAGSSSKQAANCKPDDVHPISVPDPDELDAGLAQSEPALGDVLSRRARV